MIGRRRIEKVVLLIVLVAAALLVELGSARAATALSLDRDARTALDALYAGSPAARALGATAKAILVFPEVQKAGLIFGAQSGDGAMFKDGRIVGYYNLFGLHAGLEAGIQSFSYVMFFMSDAALESFRAAKGVAIGTDPNIVIVDAGAAKDISTSTLHADVYGYVFRQKGLMAGIALQGSKITEIEP